MLPILDDGLHFVIVGTPRSGTTLVQRLASQLDGVVVPPETHFLSRFALQELRSVRFPLRGQRLRQELRRYAELDLAPVDPDAVHELLGGEAADPLALFAAVVRSLAPAARIVGEKTPAHLLWWRPLAHRFPDLRFVLVLRDPRAVVTSLTEVPWASDDVAVVAERWRRDQHVLAEAQRGLGERAVTLRFEDGGTDPDAARVAIGRLLGVDATSGGTDAVAAERLFRSDEPWKRRAAEAVDPDRAQRWRATMSPADERLVELVCRGPMRRLGYGEAPPRPASVRGVLADPARHLRRARWSIRRAQVERRSSRLTPWTGGRGPLWAGRP